MNSNKSSVPNGQKQDLVLLIISAAVFLTGILNIIGVLFAQARLRAGVIVNADAEVTLVVGLTLIYLASLLRRGKRTAWWVALPLILYILFRNFRHYLVDAPDPEDIIFPIILNLLIPLTALGGLLLYQRFFYVRSEVRNLTSAARWAVIILAVAFMYGLLGFELMDNKDFHQEISLPAAAHYTVDQFGLTTDKALVPHTKRARLFLDSLSSVSTAALFYVAISLFSPVRFRLHDQSKERRIVEELLRRYPSSSEDFFKLWPHDKAYFLNKSKDAALAYRVVGGVALAVGDPVGNKKKFSELVGSFMDYCYVNDWLAAFIHTEPKHQKLYGRHGLSTQKIGEEAIIELDHFQKNIGNNKYFRHIKNRFSREGFSIKVFTPPHSEELLKRLSFINHEWLQIPGREERGFMMGYFTPQYMQQCRIVVACDKDGKVQGFINQVPTSDKKEANFDFLRHRTNSPGNINDFLMIGFIDNLHKGGFTRLNMGLSPLAGLDDIDKGTIGAALNLVYANADRFFSFSGLKRFKDKYDPLWEDRFICYKGGIAGFTKTMASLLRAMRI